MAVLVNPAKSPLTETTLRDVERLPPAMGLQIQVLNASTSREIDAAFATIARERPDAALRRQRLLVQRPARPIGPPGDASQAPRDIFARANMPKPAG